MKENKLLHLYQSNKHLFWKYVGIQTLIFIVSVGVILGLFFLINAIASKLGYGRLSSGAMTMVTFGLIMLVALIMAIILHLRGKDRADTNGQERWYQNFWIQIVWFIIVLGVGMVVFFGLDNYLESLPTEWGWIYVGWKVGKRILLFVAIIIFWLRIKLKKHKPTGSDIEGSIRNTFNE